MSKMQKTAENDFVHTRGTFVSDVVEKVTERIVSMRKKQSELDSEGELAKAAQKHAGILELEWVLTLLRIRQSTSGENSKSGAREFIDSWIRRNLHSSLTQFEEYKITFTVADVVSMLNEQIAAKQSDTPHPVGAQEQMLSNWLRWRNPNFHSDRPPVSVGNFAKFHAAQQTAAKDAEIHELLGDVLAHHTDATILKERAEAAECERDNLLDVIQELAKDLIEMRKTALTVARELKEVAAKKEAHARWVTQVTAERCNDEDMGQ